MGTRCMGREIVKEETAQILKQQLTMLLEDLHHCSIVQHAPVQQQHHLACMPFAYEVE